MLQRADSHENEINEFSSQLFQINNNMNQTQHQQLTQYNPQEAMHNELIIQHILELVQNESELEIKLRQAFKKIGKCIILVPKLTIYFRQYIQECLYQDLLNQDKNQEVNYDDEEFSVINQDTWIFQRVRIKPKGEIQAITGEEVEQVEQKQQTIHRRLIHYKVKKDESQKVIKHYYGQDAFAFEDKIDSDLEDGNIFIIEKMRTKKNDEQDRKNKIHKQNLQRIRKQQEEDRLKKQYTENELKSKQYTTDYDGQIIFQKTMKNLPSLQKTINSEVVDVIQNKIKKKKRPEQRKTLFFIKKVNYNQEDPNLNPQEPINLANIFQPKPGVVLTTDNNQRVAAPEILNMKVNPTKSQYDQYYQNNNQNYLQNSFQQSQVEDIYEHRKNEISILSQKTSQKQLEKSQLLNTNSIIKVPLQTSYIDVQPRAHQFLNDIIPQKEFKKSLQTKQSTDSQKIMEPKKVSQRTQSMHQDPIDKFNLKILRNDPQKGSNLPHTQRTQFRTLRTNSYQINNHQRARYKYLFREQQMRSVKQLH